MRFFFGLAAASITVLGCSQGPQSFQAPPACQGTNCGVPPAGGGLADGGAGGSVTGGADAGVRAHLNGAVHRILSPDFSDTDVLFTGKATIEALSSNGVVTSADYDGSTSTAFDLEDVPLGETWFFVKDTGTGGAYDVLSTYSYGEVDGLSSMLLAVADLWNLQNIAGGLPSMAAVGVSTSLAHVVLQVERNNAPCKGVEVTAGAGGATIVYDIGLGQYSDTTTATGSAGTVLLFNSGLNGTSSITLTDTTTTQSYAVVVQAGAGAATLVKVLLQ